MHRGQVLLILYPGFVFIISIAIAPLTGRHIFHSGAIPVNHLEVEKIRLQSAPGPTYLYQQCLNHLQPPGNGQEKIVDLLILKSSNTFVAKVCG